MKCNVRTNVYTLYRNAIHLSYFVTFLYLRNMPISTRRSAEQRRNSCLASASETETAVNSVDAKLSCCDILQLYIYIGSLFTSEASSRADVNDKIRMGWLKWKEVSGTICHRKMSVELKDKVFKPIIRPAMTYGSEYWAV